MLSADRTEDILIVKQHIRGKTKEPELSGVKEFLQAEEHFREHYYCQIETVDNGFSGSMRFPGIVNGSRSYRFVIMPGILYFYELEGNALQQCADRLLKKNNRAGYGIERFLYDLFVLHIDNDLNTLEEIENHIVHLEEGVLQGKLQGFQHTMLQVKRRIRSCYRYYVQLSELGQCLQDDEAEVFSEEKRELFQKYADRTQNLASEAQILREYAMQVQEVYHSEIEIRQNNVMKMLTLITAIFLPLTLIVGWYGMNFEHMPEIGWEYGYLFVIILSAVIVTSALLMFKKKNYW